jgi:LmbE family N-acetylglucosaminyl deacetylase
MTERTCHMVCFMLILSCTFCVDGCGAEETPALNHSDTAVFCAVLAHPDDETMISGTLSMFVEKGFDIKVVYVTSGDEGADETGAGLHGNALAVVREKEARKALQIIGVEHPPVFFRYPDGQVHEYLDSVQHRLYKLFGEVSPQLIISFGPDGITGNWDHRMTGSAADQAFHLSDSARILLHMAVTKPLPPFYAGGVAVPRDSVDLRVNVSKYARKRTEVVEAHLTQFSSATRSAYKIQARMIGHEKFIIAGNRNAGEWLESCFRQEQPDK